MRAFWSDPYLWLHLAGLATVPIWLEICLLGLAVGDPVLPVWLEFFLVAGLGVAPILWMQWQRPFCIFCLLVLALSPSQLTDQQRRLLRFFRSSATQLVSIAVAIGLMVVLWQLYLRAPLVASVAPFEGQRWFGLGVAAIAFFLANLFTQVPASVLRVLLVSDAQLNAQEPYPVERILQDFTLTGFQVSRILPMPAMAMASPALSIPLSRMPRISTDPVSPWNPEISPWDESDSETTPTPTETAAAAPEVQPAPEVPEAIVSEDALGFEPAPASSKADAETPATQPSNEISAPTSADVVAEISPETAADDNGSQPTP